MLTPDYYQRSFSDGGWNHFVTWTCVTYIENSLHTVFCVRLKFETSVHLSEDVKIKQKRPCGFCLRHRVNNYCVLVTCPELNATVLYGHTDDAGTLVLA